MKKRKTYEVSVINKTYSKTYSDQTKFYTSDTALELNFQLKEVEYDFDSAEIILLNVDDRSLATRPVSKTALGFTYELEDDITARFGEWKGQLKFNEGGEIYVSSPVSFRIENDLNNDRPPQLTDICDWETLKQSAKDLIAEMGDVVANEAARIEAEKLRVEGYQEVRNFIDNFEIGENAVGTENIKDNAITPKKTTIFRPINLFDKTKLTSGGFVNEGNVVSNSNYAYSDYIEVEEGYYIVDGNPSVVADFYGNDRNYLSSFRRHFINQPYLDKTIIEVPAGAELMRVNLFLGTHETVLKVNPETFMVVRGKTYPSEYILYSGKTEKIKSEHIDLQDVPLTDFPDNLVKYPVAPENMTIFNMGPFNLFNPQTATVGGFLNNGTFNSNLDWGHSDYIPVEYGKKYIKWGNTSAKGEFYDANGGFLSNITAVESNDFIIISPPSDAKSMRVNFFIGSNPAITTTPLESLMIVEGETYPNDYIEYTDNPVPTIDAKYLPSTNLPTTSNNVLDGKSFVTAGDSLTHGPGYIPWGEVIADRNNMGFENHGISGSTLANIDGRNPFVSRWQNMPVNIDYLIFWFGWNDQANAELGLPDSTDTTTFYGALNYILPALKTKYPTTKIGVIVPFLPLAKQEYAEAVKEKAKYYGIPLYDFNADYAPLLNQRVGVSPEMIQLARDTWTYDGLHFHQEGHEFLSTVIESFMLSL